MKTILALAFSLVLAGNLAAKVRLARELGVARVDFYHYGFLRLGALDWIRAAIEA